MNIKQVFLGLSAIGGFLTLTIIFWAILERGGSLCLNATLYTKKLLFF